MHFSILFLIVFPIKSAVCAISTSLGKEFLVALPIMMDTGDESISTITFIMSTFAHKRVKVLLSCVGTDAPDLNKAIDLIRMSPVKHLIDPTYRSKVEIGHKWTYKLQSDTLFSLFVILITDTKSMDTLLALPKVAWGTKYIAITSFTTPYIQVISASDENPVRVSLRITGDEVTFMYGGRRYKDNDTLEFKLKEGESFSLSDCHSKRFVSLTGTLITGSKEIGVISGNCQARITTVVCADNDIISSALSKDIVAEMMFPLEASGLTFIVIDMPKRLVNVTYSIVGEENTEVTVTNGNDVITIILDNTRSVFLETEKCCPQVKSNKPIQVAYVPQSACLGMVSDYQFVVGEPLGDASLTMLVPNELFYVMYNWRTPGMSNLLGDYAALVVKSEQILDLRLDGDKLDSELDWKQVAGGSEYKVGHVTVSTGNHVLTSKIKARFGCYIYGLGHEIMYMHPAAIQDCKSYPGAQSDVNCDASFDKETTPKSTTSKSTRPLSTSGLTSTTRAAPVIDWVSMFYMVGFYVLLMTLGLIFVALLLLKITKKKKQYENRYVGED